MQSARYERSGRSAKALTKAKKITSKSSGKVLHTRQVQLINAASQMVCNWGGSDMRLYKFHKRRGVLIFKNDDGTKVCKVDVKFQKQRVPDKKFPHRTKLQWHAHAGVPFWIAHPDNDKPQGSDAPNIDNAGSWMN